MLNDPDYILGAGADTGVLLGGFLEVIVALAGIGTAVALYPVVKRQNEGFALGFVATRILEAAVIFTGVVSLLSLVTLRQDLGGATGADAAIAGHRRRVLVATYDWTFLLGQSLMPGMNALLLGTLMYRSGLVPRILPSSDSSEPRCCSPPRRDPVRRHRAVLPGRRPLGRPDRCVGVLARSVADVQGLQGLRTAHGRGGCPVGQPGWIGNCTAFRSRRRDEPGRGMTAT